MKWLAVVCSIAGLVIVGWAIWPDMFGNGVGVDFARQIPGVIIGCALLLGAWWIIKRAPDSK